MNQDFLKLIREKAAERLLFLPHAVGQMSRPDRMIQTSEIRKVIEEGTIIEDYPEDARGHSCLMLGWGGENRPIHVVCSPKDVYLAIITAYLPDQDQWLNDFTTRRET
jgi:hypothetical protein